MRVSISENYTDPRPAVTSFKKSLKNDHNLKSIFLLLTIIITIWISATISWTVLTHCDSTTLSTEKIWENGEWAYYTRAKTSNISTDLDGITTAYFCLPFCQYLRQITFEGNITCNGMPTNLTDHKDFGGITVHVVVICKQTDPQIVYKKIPQDDCCWA